jgi:branched-chain amino acid transport system substrate-binding protein
MKKTLITTLLLGMFAVPAFAADSIKIAITGPFSGGSAPMGTSMRDGAACRYRNQVRAIMSPTEDVLSNRRDDEGKNELCALIAQELA